MPFHRLRALMGPWPLKGPPSRSRGSRGLNLPESPPHVAPALVHLFGCFSIEATGVPSFCVTLPTRVHTHRPCPGDGRELRARAAAGAADSAGDFGGAAGPVGAQPHAAAPTPVTSD